MAHNINITNGVASFAFTGEKPWTRLGTEIPGLMKTREAIVAGRLDWTVSKRPLITGDTDALLVSDRFAIVRDDTKAILGTVGPGYTPVQNVEAFAPFDSVLGEAACIETVGALGKGERIFAMARLPRETFEPAPGDPVESFFLMTTTHNGEGTVKILFTPVRVVCQNTLAAALRGAKHVISVKHTKGVHEGLKLAPKILAASAGYWQRIREAYATMAKRQADRTRVREFLARLFPGKVNDFGEVTPTAHLLKLRSKVEALFDGGAVGADKAGHTDWGLLNAVSDYVERHRKVRVGSAWESSVFGDGARLRQEAFNLLTASS